MQVITCKTRHCTWYKIN